jgi:type IV pilus assembly protein PilC
MAEFVCRLGTPGGEIVTRTVEAPGANEARARLEGEGFRVFAINTAKAGGAAGGGGMFGVGGGARLKPNDFLLFNQQFSALLRAGIPILQAVSMLRRRSPSAALRSVLADVEEKIRGGTALSEAFAAQGLFPRIYTASLLAGERSGALDEILSRYVNFMRRSVGLRRKIRAALAYPILLLIASVIMVVFLVLYVVPRMSELFKDFGGAQLPLITRVVVGISTWTTQNIFWLGPLILVSLAGAIFWSRTSAGRLAIDRFLLKTPILGKLITQSTTAQVTRSLATLLAGGITLVESWDIAAESIGNVELRRRSESILPMLREGRSFTECLTRANWIPELALDMIGVGEGSGSLREMLEEVAGFYDAEAEVRLEQLTSTLEPAILLVMASIVIVILMAIYLPIIQSVSNPPSLR